MRKYASSLVRELTKATTHLSFALVLVDGYGGNGFVHEDEKQ